MIDIDKIYTENPFVDEVIYYTKYMALNSVVKDEDQAIANETAESDKAGTLYIACYEGRARYNMFTSFPKEILQKYIPESTNLDAISVSYTAIKTYLNSLSLIERTRILNNITKLIQTVYIDHYDIMLDYLRNLDPNWIVNNEDLYNKCVNLSATYIDLYESLPSHTIKMILLRYLNNYNNTDIDSLSNDFGTFSDYVLDRTDGMPELKDIENAMRLVFKSHYDMMLMREYLSTNGAKWWEYNQFTTLYTKCMNKTIRYIELYNNMPANDRLDSLLKGLDQTTIDAFNLNEDVDTLIRYFNNNPNQNAIDIITEDMRVKYLNNYNMYLNFDIYNKCKDGVMTFEEMMQYVPRETVKIILNTEIELFTNIEVYSKNKKMLDSYLSTLPIQKAASIKESITKDMQVWYIDNYEELNNYYRIIMGLPPIINGVVCNDYLTKTYDANTDEYISLGNKYVKQLTALGIYPESHWTKTKLHEFDAYDIAILTEYGIIDDYISSVSKPTNSSRYKYINYLGDNKLDIYTCRKALNFQLISCPMIDNTIVRNKFMNIFAVNRDYIIRTVYSDAYKFQSEYYNKFIIVFMIVTTINDMLGDIPDLIIHKDIFDTRAIKYLFESYGIPYYSEIPVKYQQAMLKNLNTLIKYKSSTKNMIDICKLFGFEDIKVFEYYMFKQKVVDVNTGEYVFNDNTEIDYDLDLLYVKDPGGDYKDYNGIRFSKLLDYHKYDENKYLKTITVQNENGESVTKKIINNKQDVYIKDTTYKNDNVFLPLLDTDYFNKLKVNTDESVLNFIKVPIDSNFIDCKNDSDYTLPYEEVVSGDDTWTGGIQPELIESDIIDYEFNAVKTKYISVETITEMTELSFQVSYFYNMIFDNLYNEELLVVEIPYIKIGHKFRFMDVICYLFALMYLYHGLNDTIMYSPTQMLYIKGYNFNEDLNKVLEDINSFTQTENPMEQENIFDINERIKEDGYNYREAFNAYNVSAFNLEVDIDELDAWLMKNYQLSLDDFVVDDSDINNIITLRNFYSLNNSFYQKSIFDYTYLQPYGYNQINGIKYAFGCELYKLLLVTDINTIQHKYVQENDYKMIVIENTDDIIYIPDQFRYCESNNVPTVLYNKYEKTDSGFVLSTVDYYTYLPKYEEYATLLNGNIYVKDADGDYLLAADAYYKKNELGGYVEYTGSDYIYTDDNNKQVITLGKYYILNSNNEWVLDPNNCWIQITDPITGNITYDLATNQGKYDVKLTEADMYIRHSDSHFIPLLETDYYRKQEDGSYKYDEEECFVRVDYITTWIDPTDNPVIYYDTLSNYYKNHYKIGNCYYVKDADGNFIPETRLIDPDNCYIYNDYTNQYVLAIDNYCEFIKYSNDNLSFKYALILDESNDYLRHSYGYLKYDYTPDINKRYVQDSQDEYVIVLLLDKKYEETKYMITVLNSYVATTTISQGKLTYIPEETDKVWDENDWFYTDPSYDPDNAVGMNGENNWYYKKPGEDTEGVDDDIKTPVGTGYYIAATNYLNSVKLIPGCKYYMSFDVETNFDNKVQIVCEADNEYNSNSTYRIYNMETGEKQHVEQTFIANNITTPRILFLIFNYEKIPVNAGDYIIISNIKFVKANNDNYIAQDIPSYEKLQQIYATNKSIYQFLIKLMVECSDHDTYMIYQKLYDSLMTSKYNKEAFKLEDGTYAKTYTDFLQTRDSVLYERLTYFKSLDTESMQKQIADSIIEVTYAIDGVVDTYSYGYLYSYFPAVSASYIQQYISKIINFFKSWKVHLLGINTIYKFDDPSQNTIKILEDQQYRVRLDERIDNIYINDCIKVNPIDDYSPNGMLYTELYNDIPKYNLEKEDNIFIDESIRIIVRTADELRYIDNEVELVLNDDTINAYTDEDGNLIVSDNSGLAIEIPNTLAYDDNETDTVFGSEKISEINKYSVSTDIIERRNKEDE